MSLTYFAWPKAKSKNHAMVFRKKTALQKCGAVFLLPETNKKSVE